MEKCEHISVKILNEGSVSVEGVVGRENNSSSHHNMHLTEGEQVQADLLDNVNEVEGAQVEADVPNNVHQVEGMRYKLILM